MTLFLLLQCGQKPINLLLIVCMLAKIVEYRNYSRHRRFHYRKLRMKCQWFADIVFVSSTEGGIITPLIWLHFMLLWCLLMIYCKNSHVPTCFLILRIEYKHSLVTDICTITVFLWKRTSFDDHKNLPCVHSATPLNKHILYGCNVASQ